MTNIDIETCLQQFKILITNYCQQVKGCWFDTLVDTLAKRQLSKEIMKELKNLKFNHLPKPKNDE